MNYRHCSVRPLEAARLAEFCFNTSQDCWAKCSLGECWSLYLCTGLCTAICYVPQHGGLQNPIETLPAGLRGPGRSLPANLQRIAFRVSAASPAVALGVCLLVQVCAVSVSLSSCVSPRLQCAFVLYQVSCRQTYFGRKKLVFTY